MIIRSTTQNISGPALEFDEAFELARTQPTVCKKPGHLTAVVAGKGGHSLLCLRTAVRGQPDGDPIRATVEDIVNNGVLPLVGTRRGIQPLPE
jgi:hypothetical protein